MPQTVDTLITPRWIAPVEPVECLLEDHAIAINDGLIVDILERERAERHYRAEKRITLDKHIAIPGLVNTHTHAAMTLLRGMADDMPLVRWLNRYIWPTEARCVDESFVRTGTGLAIAEMLRGGTTCFNDMYFYPNIVAGVAQDFGMRAVVGLISIEFPTAWARSAGEYLRKGIAVHDETRNLALITTAFAPHAPYTVSDDTLKRIQTLADELDIPIHMHVHETEHEIDESIKLHNVRPLERLSRLGLLTPRLLAVHMTQLLDAEIDALAEQGVHVVHCPESNLKLASGACPVAALLQSNVNVAIGTDGAASNNDLDMLGELRTAALFAKGLSRDPTAVPAHQALRLATLNGARALGLDQLTGSLLPGKAADIAVVDLDNPATHPVYDPVTQLVYSAGRDQISDVWVHGRHVIAAGEYTTLDRCKIMHDADVWRDQIRAGGKPDRSAL